MRFCMLFAVKESVYFVFQFFLVCFVNDEFMFTELHFTNVVCTLTFPFQNKINLWSTAIGSCAFPTIVAVDGGYAQFFFHLL